MSDWDWLTVRQMSRTQRLGSRVLLTVDSYRFRKVFQSNADGKVTGLVYRNEGHDVFSGGLPEG